MWNEFRDTCYTQRWCLFYVGFNLLDRSITLRQLLDLIVQLSLYCFFRCSLSVTDHPPVFATAKILSNYIPLSHYTPLSSPALGDNRGIHHTISCRRFYKLSKMLHRENSNYRPLHYTLKYALCLALCVYSCFCVCLCEWWWYRESCSPPNDWWCISKRRGEKWWQVATSLTPLSSPLSIFLSASLCVVSSLPLSIRLYS